MQLLKVSFPYFSFVNIFIYVLFKMAVIEKVLSKDQKELGKNEPMKN